MVKNDQSSSNAHFIFWAWHNNDIDHMVPIIYGLLKNGISSNRIRYIALTPHSNIFPEQDMRLKFIKQLGINFEMPHVQKLIHKIFFYFIQRKSKNNTVRYLLKILKFIYKKIFGNDPTKWPNWDYALNLIDDISSDSIFIFDHNTSLLHGAIINKAKKKYITCISVPHGLVTFYEHPGGEVIEKVKSTSKKKHSLEIYDWVIMPNKFSADRQIRLGLSPKKIVCLGSARFCSEWIEIISKIYPKPIELPDNELKINVLFLMEKGEADGRQISFVDEQMRSIKFLNEDPNINLIIKYNTRGISKNKKKALKSIKCMKFDHEYATPELISWSDVVVAGGTSVIFDPLMRGEIVIIMGYIHPVTFVYPEYESPAFANSFEEFTIYFKKLIKNQKRKLYNIRNTQKLFRNFIFHSNNKKNILQNYSNFLIQMTKYQ